VSATLPPLPTLQFPDTLPLYPPICLGIYNADLFGLLDILTTQPLRFGSLIDFDTSPLKARRVSHSSIIPGTVNFGDSCLFGTCRIDTDFQGLSEVLHH
jgi:hypothetical protein